MKKALSIINAHAVTDGPLHFHSRMKEELEPLGYALELKTNAEILAAIDSDGNLIDPIQNAAFVLYLDKDLYLSHHLRSLGHILFNDAKAIRLCDDKMLTHLALANNGIKMPKTLSAPLAYSNAIAVNFLETVKKTFPFPLVAKENFGSLGKNVYLIQNEIELENFEKSRHSTPHLYQEFIKSSFGFDYRVIVIGGIATAWMKRINKTGDFRSNIAQHATSEKTDLPPAYIEMAEKAARSLRLDYCGIDLLEGQNGEPILCEVNSNAFLRGIEKTTGVNVAKAYAHRIADVIEGKAERL